jgi:hypothetical protein
MSKDENESDLNNNLMTASSLIEEMLHPLSALNKIISTITDLSPFQWIHKPSWPPTEVSIIYNEQHLQMAEWIAKHNPSMKWIALTQDKEGEQGCILFKEQNFNDCLKGGHITYYCKYLDIPNDVSDQGKSDCRIDENGNELYCRYYGQCEAYD